MGTFTNYPNGFDEEGHPNTSGLAEVTADTSHPQGDTADDLEVDYVGSSTMKRLDPNTDTLVNTPGNDQKIIPVGATVVDGTIQI